MARPTRAASSASDGSTIGSPSGVITTGSAIPPAPAVPQIAHRARVAAAALRTVDKRGGLDGFLAKAKDDELSAKMLKIKREIAKKQQGETAVAA